MGRRRTGWRRILPGLWLVVAVPATAWTVTALWFQSPLPWRGLWIAVAIAVATAIPVLTRGRPRLRLCAFIAALAVVALWWSSIRPSNNRDWAPDVAHGVTAEIQGSRLVVRNVRDFEWRTRQDFEPRWRTEVYHLDDLVSADLISSVWANPAIAHTLISFGFSDGRHLVFSAEIRRERHEVFSEVGGFFKEFELVLIAAEERDIVRLRTDVRGETVSRFSLRVAPEQARSLLVSYLEAGNALTRKPRFYQTITTNCTTVIFRLARLVQPGIPADWRILVSGYLPDYLYQHSMIRTDIPLDDVKRQAVIPPSLPSNSRD